MNQYFNPYAYQGQKIQNLSSVIQNEVQVFYVNNPTDMERINPMQNVVYIGLNNSTKEIYVRQLNGMGLIDFDVYVRQSGEQQKNDLTKILEKLDEIMKGKDNVIQSSNGTIGNEYVDKGYVKKSPTPAKV
jgi:hypothetical protein